MTFSIFKIILITTVGFISFAPSVSTPYSLKVADINGRDSINFNDFKGKKILVVNTAISSEYSGQFASLDSLYRKNRGALVVIVFPSNSFGNESEKNRDIKRILKKRYGFHFLMAEKTDVTGGNASPVYKWLTNKTLNNAFNITVKTDFYKFLIGTDGRLLGVFSAKVDPLDSLIQKAISTNF